LRLHSDINASLTSSCTVYPGIVTLNMTARIDMGHLIETWSSFAGTSVQMMGNSHDSNIRIALWSQ
jgi:hypothetical protein